jgi:hypothetical protein
MRKNQIKRKNVIFAIDSIVRARFDPSARPSTRGYIASRYTARASAIRDRANPRVAICGDS